MSHRLLWQGLKIKCDKYKNIHKTGNCDVRRICGYGCMRLCLLYGIFLQHLGSDISSVLHVAAMLPERFVVITTDSTSMLHDSNIQTKREGEVA